MPKNGRNRNDVEFLDRVCPHCKYGVCGDCVVHCSYRGGIDRGTCFCKDSNFGYDYDADPNKRNHYQHGTVSKAQRSRVNQILFSYLELLAHGFIRTATHQIIPKSIKQEICKTYLDTNILIKT
eukprot:394452_1